MSQLRRLELVQLNTTSVAEHDSMDTFSLVYYRIQPQTSTEADEMYHVWSIVSTPLEVKQAKNVKKPNFRCFVFIQ